MIKRMTTISVAALALVVAAPLSASAQTGGFFWLGGDAPRDTGARYPQGSHQGHGFYLNAPNYPYVPNGGNSGGANFPHSGT